MTKMFGFHDDEYLRLEKYALAWLVLFLLIKADSPFILELHFFFALYY